MTTPPARPARMAASSAPAAPAPSPSPATTSIAENLTIANDFEKRHARTDEGSQAVALHVTGDREIFRKVRFLGFQDTLYADSKLCHAAPMPGSNASANAGATGAPASGSGSDTCYAARQYYSDCYVEGHVDFIFGDARAVFDHCEIHTLPH